MGLKDNDYVDLKGGDRITLRNGNVLTYDEYYDKITNSEDSRLQYTDNLLHKTRRELDIVEIKRPVEYQTIFTENDRVEEDDVIDETIDTSDITDALNKLCETIKKGKGAVITIKF